MSMPAAVTPVPEQVYTLEPPSGLGRYEWARHAKASATGHWVLDLEVDQAEKRLYPCVSVLEPPWDRVVVLKLPPEWSLHWCLEDWGPYLYAFCRLPDNRPCWVLVSNIANGWRPWGQNMTLGLEDIAPPPFPPGAVVLDALSLAAETPAILSVMDAAQTTPRVAALEHLVAEQARQIASLESRLETAGEVLRGV